MHFLNRHSLAAFMIFWNYRLCVITSPGSVPEGWVSYFYGGQCVHRPAREVDANVGWGYSRGPTLVQWRVWKLKKVHIRRDTARHANITNHQEVNALSADDEANADSGRIAHHCRQCKTCWVRAF